MASRQPETIQTLIDAEADARMVIAEARKYRDSRVKEADVQARKEIDLYREKREAEYKEEVARIAGNTGSTAETIAKEAQDNVKSTHEMGALRRPQVGPREGRKPPASPVPASLLPFRPCLGSLLLEPAVHPTCAIL
jgi:V-type H+-transporting ATPase subunit G